MMYAVGDVINLDWWPWGEVDKGTVLEVDSYRYLIAWENPHTKVTQKVWITREIADNPPEKWVDRGSGDEA